MAVLPILITGDPVLHTVASPITDFDHSLLSLVEDMFDTMEAAPGVGLAGPQVGVSRRIFVFHWEDDAGQTHRGTAINPELWISPPPIGAADEDDDSEGCLSIPGERFPLRRSELAILRAVDEHNVPFEIRAEGWLARIFQHEFDHLDGILYADRLEHLHAKAATKAIRKNGWGRPGESWMPGVDNLDE
jgi:peptide deformylase